MKSREQVVFSDGKRYRVPFQEVAASKKLQAEEMLKVKSYFPLSFNQAQFLSKGSYRKTKRLPYLVRAVYLNRETGGFLVSQIRSDLFVFHVSLGHSAVPMQRQALIVNLPEAPKNVYAECSMAE